MIRAKKEGLGVGWAGCIAVAGGGLGGVTSAVGGTTATADGHGPTGRDREGAQ